MAANPRPTIKDVARTAGVSLSTVSYILNEAPAAERISPQTKKRVWAAAAKLGYKFNPIGRALQKGYTNQVTLLIVTWNLATSHSATAMAISQAAARHDLALTVHVADDDESAEAFVRRTIFHNLGGVLILWDSPAFAKSSIRQVAQDNVPVVDLLPGSPNGISVVTADREDAGYRATRHLMEQGHRHIGMIGDILTRPKTTLQKLAGYRRALRESGMKYDESLIQNVTEFGFEGGQAGFLALQKRCPEVTGLFCINDAIALGSIEAAKDLGWNCPIDLSVVGFGDSAEGSHWRPKLTTFSLSPNRVADSAIKLIIDHRAKPDLPAEEILIPEEFLLRESTGPAAVH